MNLIKNVKLSQKTTIGLGAKVPYFIEIKNLEELSEALKFIKENHLFYFILGEGSNTIAIDKEIPIAILHPVNNQIIYKIDKKEFIYNLPVQIQYNNFYNIDFQCDLYEAIQFYTKKNKKIQIIADAGINWDYFVYFNLLHGIPHFIALSGIPGKIGSTPIQNVGAYGEEVKSFIEYVYTYTFNEQKVKVFSNKECDFKYRDSIFKKYLNQFYIYQVIFNITLNDSIQIKYPELQKIYLDYKNNSNLELWEESLLHILNLNRNIKEFYLLRKCVYTIRRKKGMILDNSEFSKSAGSFFTNPILTEEEFIKLKNHLLIENFPFFREGKYFKIPAAWLIEFSGIKKGFRYKNWGISPLHALAIINYGGTLEELKEFIQFIQKNVYNKTGILLKPEPVFMEDFIYKF
ncbi:MAG: UDP-N-acetylenolpyruvoylglucosamine reductase [Leptospiraceae bacterium]|nr:MAG: UDP-N-acetylenolpyruvoylglucosamine reductase [Leptospiraceae bacterium]